MKGLQKWLRLMKWRWDNNLIWFLMKKPVEEFKSEIVEGKPGEGKTRYLAAKACRYMRRGYIVASNFSVRDRLTGMTSVPISNMLDVLRLCVRALELQQPVMFCIDEFHLWADARNWKATPDWFRWLISQHRHFGVAIIGATQSFTMVEKTVRFQIYNLTRIRNKTFLRVPLFMFETVAPESVLDDGSGEYSLSSPMPYFMPWYGGYDTQELVMTNNWKTDDPAVVAEIEALSARARELVKPGVIPAAVDYIPDFAQVVKNELEFYAAVGRSKEVIPFVDDIWVNEFAQADKDIAYTELEEYSFAE